LISMPFLTYQEHLRMFENTAEYPALVIATVQLVGMIGLICLSYVSYRAGYAPHYECSATRTRRQTCMRLLLLWIGAISAYAALFIALLMTDYSHLIFPMVFLLMPPFGLPYLMKQWFTRNSNSYAGDHQIHGSDEK
jgi:hypothetical protein